MNFPRFSLQRLINDARAAFVVVPSSVQDMQSWRERLLERVLVTVFVLGNVAAVPSIWASFRDGFWALIGADILALIAVYVIWQHRALGYRLRATVFLAVLYLMSVALLLTVGQASQIYLMAFPVMTVLLRGLRPGLWALGLSWLTLIVVGYTVNADIVIAGLDLSPAIKWLVISVNFLLVTAALTLSVAFLLRGLDTALQRERTNADNLAYLASHDILTDLANRSLMKEELQRAIARAVREQRLVAVLLIDLDGFKNVNDTLGHSAGDQLIAQAAQRLIACVREGDTVARLGGDEFVVILAEIMHEDEIATAAKRILHSMAGCYVLDAHEAHVTGSIGVAVAPRDGTTVDALIKGADTAMYRAKEAGRNRFQFYHADMNVRLAQRLTLENQLRHALEREQLVLHFQPQFNLASNTLVAAEALVRWRHPSLGDASGLVSPAQFIPIAEENGLIVPIGDWIMREACAQARRWQEAHGLRLRIAVNISARQFHSKNLLPMVRYALQDNGLTPDQIELEITESMVMQDPLAAIELLKKFKALGLRIALDDFGTGFSSLAYLKRFPIDVIKIDQSFVRGLTTVGDTPVDSADLAIVRSVNELARSLGLVTVAEGVETRAQEHVLRSLKVCDVQGFLFGRPVPAEEFAQWLHNLHNPGLPAPSHSG